MLYKNPYILEWNQGNNSISYTPRQILLQKEPSLYIPKRIFGEIEDVTSGNQIVFEEFENWILRQCSWLKHFVTITKENQDITIFDNHNHALFFWCEAIALGRIAPGFELIHIDEHSDLWENENIITDYTDLENIWGFTNFQCTVGNYIQPALRAGIIQKMIRIENEFQIEEYIHYTPQKNSILNLDLDIFSPELSYIPENITLKCIKHLISQVRYVTIATSPYFIDQKRALWMLQKIFL